MVTRGGERESSMVAPPPSDLQPPVGRQTNETIHWHPRGVAARVLALQQHMEKPTSRVTYTVVLEGRCRFGVQEFNVHDLYNTARVTQLDSTKAEMEQAEKDPEVQVLARQFKSVAGDLISLLEPKLKAVERTKALLETASAHKLADIFVASFEGSFDQCLAMLDAVDLRQRLLKATEIITRHLQTLRVAEKISMKVEGNLSKSQKDVLRQQIRAIKDELGDNDDDEDNIVALERKMQSVGMPANVWKHAQRELRYFSC
jgi:ATP-dependent Lon protease